MKKKTKVFIIILSVLLIMISILMFFIIKYILDHRYLTYKELQPNQLILIREEMYESTKDGKIVYIRAIDAEGNLYSVYVPYEEWEGIEFFFEEIVQGEKTANYMTKEEMELVYGYVIEIDENNSLKYHMDCVPPVKPFYKEYCYGIRYQGNKTVEYIKYYEERTYAERYYLEDSSAKKLRELVGGRL